MNTNRTRTFHTSGEIAKARARITVASDRLDCDPETFAQMKRELKELLCRYMSLDREAFDLQLSIVYGKKRGILDAKTIQITGL